MSNRIQVLDKGYIDLVDTLGTDLTPVNAARASFKKRSDEMNEKDERLLHFLAENGHTAPYRHAMLQFEIHAPLMVARQWWKHCIGSAHQGPLDLSMCNAWNEASGRYVDLTEEFYVPTPSEWRGAPANKKQGSEGHIGTTDGWYLTAALEEYIDEGLRLFEHAKKQGVATEQARLFLPAYGVYTTWYWTVSLQALCHFFNLRLDSHAQFEIREYAKAALELARPKFPISIEALVREDLAA